MRIRPFALTAPLILLVACGPSGSGGGDGDDTGGDDDPGQPDAREYPPDAPPWDPGDGGMSARCEKIDILFVVDNSGSMGEEQTNLATNFPAFIQVIDESGLDWRVAVTSTDMDYTYYQQTPLGNLPMSSTGGENGAMLQRCSMARRWIEKTDPDAATTFGCAASLGTDGSPDEMPLAAVRAAFDERMADGTNAGFHRDDALLAVVMLTDENDCSYEQSVTMPFGQSLCDDMMEPVANYVGFLDAYTGDRARWAAVAIAGPGPDSCSSEFGSAAYAERLDQFIQMTGTNGLLSSICEGDLTVALGQALELFSAACDDFPPID